MPQDRAVNPRLRSIASTATAIALAVFALPCFMYALIIWDPGHYGEFGLFSDPGCCSVVKVIAGSPADRAGIKPGDIVDRPRALHDRLVLAWTAPHPGERITLSVLHGSQLRTVTIQARPLAQLPSADRVLLGLKVVWLFVFLAVSFGLVVLRPSMMTWGFYLFALNLTLLFWPSYLFFSYIPAGWLVAMMIAQDIVAPAGVVGFLIFGIRFPANVPTGWRRAIESLVPYLYVALAAGVIYMDLRAAFIAPPTALVFYASLAAMVAIFLIGTIPLLTMYTHTLGPERLRIAWALFGLVSGAAGAGFGLHMASPGGDAPMGWVVIPILMLGSIALLITYFEARGLERHRIKWVVVGLICAFFAHVADLTLSGSTYQASSLAGVIEPLYVALPLAVAYAVFRHRVIDIRFVASRSLAFGVIVSLVAAIFIGIDWLFSTRLPNSHLETAAYVGVALLIGFSLNAARQRVGSALPMRCVALPPRPTCMSPSLPVSPTRFPWPQPPCSNASRGQASCELLRTAGLPAPSGTFCRTIRCYCARAKACGLLTSTHFNGRIATYPPGSRGPRSCCLWSSAGAWLRC